MNEKASSLHELAAEVGKLRRWHRKPEDNEDVQVITLISKPHYEALKKLAKKLCFENVEDLIGYVTRQYLQDNEKV
jgi:hypothetical protein